MTWLIILAYLYSIVDGVHIFLEQSLSVIKFLTFVSIGVGLLVAFICSLEPGAWGNFSKWFSEGSGKSTLKSWGKTLLIAWIVVGVTKVVIPTSEGMKYIAGAAIVAYSAEAFANIDGMDKLPANIVEMINALVEDITNDVKGDMAGGLDESASADSNS